MWKLLDQAMASRFLSPLHTLALLTPRVVQSRWAQLEAYRALPRAGRAVRGRAGLLGARGDESHVSTACSVHRTMPCMLVQAYIRWEKEGKPNYPPEKQLVEFEEARKELQAELDKGTSIDQLRKKILKGNIESKVSKQLKNKKYFSVERTQCKSRDIMQLLNKYKPTVIEDQAETAPKQPTVLDLFTKSLQEQDGCKVLCRKLFTFADMEILALATNSLGQTKVYLATNHMEPLILHWALPKKAGEWKAPPSSILPSGSTLLDKACEALFSESELDGLHYQVVEIELDDGRYKGMPFVLRSGETWIKNNGSDFYLDFSTQLTKNIKGTGDAGKGTAKALLERIADLEEDAQRSLMHRCYWCNHSCSNAASTQGPNQTSGTTKRLVVIKDDSDHEVTVTLWGQRAKDFDAEYVYEKSQKKPIAILFVGVLMKRYGQNEGLSGGSACRWYISPNIPEATTIESSYVFS